MSKSGDLFFGRRFSKIPFCQYSSVYKKVLIKKSRELSYMNCLIDSVLYILILYFIFSFTEYTVHKYFMHSSYKTFISDGHWNHHKHVLDDMNLKQSDLYNSNENKFLGLYFVWSYSVIVFLVGLAEGLILRVLLNYIGISISIFWVFVWVLFFSIYQSSFWNTVHPDIHGIREPLEWSEGIPGSSFWVLLFSSFIIDREKGVTLYDWFKSNHTMHHLRKGVTKGNYNVTLPGADWILGTMYTSVK